MPDATNELPDQDPPLNQVEEEVVKPPIQVQRNSAIPVAMTAIRDVAKVGAAYALGRGWIQGDTQTMIMALVPILGPSLWSMWLSFKHNVEKKVMEAHVPSSVAVLKGPPPAA